MSTYQNDIKRIAREKENPGGLSAAVVRSLLPGSVKIMTGLQKDESGVTMVAPLTFEVLTYDDSQDVEVDTPTGTATIKTAETAQIIDSLGQVWPIDTIIYPPQP